jgi:hypothetical protein
MQDKSGFRRWGLFVVLAALALVGCGKSNPFGAVPVSGKVTYRGQPVDQAIVTFAPEGDTRPATAITVADGSFNLMTLDAEGAMPGRYVALVRKTEIPPEPAQGTSMEEALKLNARPPPAPKSLLPAKYGDAQRSPLKFEVKNGADNRFDLMLED